MYSTSINNIVEYCVITVMSVYNITGNTSITVGLQQLTSAPTVLLHVPTTSTVALMLCITLNSTKRYHILLHCKVHLYTYDFTIHKLGKRCGLYSSTYGTHYIFHLEN